MRDIINKNNEVVGKALFHKQSVFFEITTPEHSVKTTELSETGFETFLDFFNYFVK